MEKKAEAYRKYNGAAMAEMMIKIMPQMAAEIAKPLGQIDKINIYSTGTGSDGRSEVRYSIKLDAQSCEDIRSIYGKKADNAITAVEEGRVLKYLDFFVVIGNTGEYVVVDDFCTCHDFAFRQIECWHILAVRIAKHSGSYTCIDEWYLDRLLKNGSEPDSRSEAGKQ